MTPLEQAEADLTTARDVVEVATAEIMRARAAQREAVHRLSEAERSAQEAIAAEAVARRRVALERDRLNRPLVDGEREVVDEYVTRRVIAQIVGYTPAGSMNLRVERRELDGFWQRVTVETFAARRNSAQWSYWCSILVVETP